MITTCSSLGGAERNAFCVVPSGFVMLALRIAMAKPVNASREREDDEETLWDFLTAQSAKFYVDHIPIDTFRDLPKAYLFYYGTVAYICLIAIFSYFLYVNYQDAINQAYISLEEDSGNCDTVPIVVNGNYLADNKGNWQGAPDFLDSKAIYQLTFSGFEINSVSQYQQMMGTFYDSLSLIADTAVHNSLAENMIIWMTFVRYYSVLSPSSTNFTSIGFGQLQSLTLTGIPAAVFDVEHVFGNVAAIGGACNVSGYSKFSSSESTITTTFGSTELFLASPLCGSALNPTNFGYLYAVDGSIFQLPYDVRSLSLALAVNYGYIALDLLTPLTRNARNFTFNGTEYSLAEYFDTRFPFMEAVVCMQNLTALPVQSQDPQTLCLTTSQNSVVLPVFNHVGASATQPIYCDCSTPAGSQKSCSVFNFMPGMVFFNTKSTHAISPSQVFQSEYTTELLEELGVFNLMALVARYDSYLDFNRAAYNASFVASTPGYVCDSACLAAAFAFCAVNASYSCSVFAYTAESILSTEVSAYKYQVVNGSCTNSMTVSPSIWQKLVENPPVQFTQDYFECYDTKSSAMLNALGVASGNTQLFVPVAVIALLPLLYFSLVLIRQVPPKEEYNSAEKDQVLAMLAVLLLRLRDGKTRGIKRQGVLLQVAKEMIAAAKDEGGYPDSDDEEEEDDAPQRSKPKDSLISEVSASEPAPNQQPQPPRKTRLRMAVMTKHLQSPAPLPGDARASSVFFRTFSMRPSVAVKEEAQAPRVSEMVERKPRVSDSTGGMFGFLLGAPKRPAAEPVSPLTKYIDLSAESAPPDILVLNQAAFIAESRTFPARFKRSLSTQETGMLLEDLNKLFFECVSTHPGGGEVHNALRDSDSSMLSMSAAPSRRDLPTFRQATAVSARLAKIDLGHFLEAGDAAFFMKVSNLLCIHASLELGLEMRDVAVLRGHSVAYNVGQRLLTIAQLQAAV